MPGVPRNLQLPPRRRFGLNRPDPRPTYEGILGPTYLATTLGIAAVMTLVAFEGMAAATVMPVVVHALHGLAFFSWTYNAWVASSLVAMVVSGQIADRHGPRRALVGGLSLFAIGGGLAALAPAMWVFVVGRAVQGLGAGAGIVALYVVIARVYPEPVRPKVFSAMSASWVLPSLLGPVVAGWVADRFTWRLVFGAVPLLVLPAAAMLLARMQAMLPTDADPAAPERSRAPQGILAALGLVAFQQGLLERTPAWWVVSALGLSLAAYAGRSLLPVGTVRLARGLPAVIGMRAIASGSYFAAEAFVPLALTGVRHVSITISGLVLTAGALSWALGSLLQSRTSWDRVRVARAGVIMAAAAVLGLPVGLGAPNPALACGVALFVGAFGMGMFFPSQGVLLLRYSPESDQGRNSASLQVSDALGGVVLLSTAGAVQAAAVDQGGPTAGTFTVIWTGLGLALALGATLVGRMRAGT